MSDALPPFYGTGVKMVGLDTCDAYQKQQKPHMRRWAPAGMFNTGTNTLLRSHAHELPVPGPHGPPRLLAGALGEAQPAVVARRALGAAVQGERRFRPDPLSILPVVVVKDPTTWMKSMCRNQYGAGSGTGRRTGARRVRHP